MLDSKTKQEKIDCKNTKENASDHINHHSNKENNINPQNINKQIINQQSSFNNPDIILLVQLLPALTKAATYLKELLHKLAVDAETITKMPYSLVNSSAIWNLKQAKENLDILVINAVLGNTQQIKYKEWIVELELKRVSEAVNK